MYRYIVYLILEESGEFKTFQEAFEKLYWAAKKQVEEKKTALIIFETNCIVYDNKDTEKGLYINRSLNLKAARDFAHKMGARQI